MTKFTAYRSSPSVETYPSLPDHIIWLRLCLGFVYGISLGFRESSQDPSIQGATGIIFGVNVIMFLPIIYLNFYLNAQIDSYKGLNFAGVQNGLALMMLIWIIFFTMLHEEEEMALNAAVVQSVVKAAVGENDNVAETGEVVEDSEF